MPSNTAHATVIFVLTVSIALSGCNASGGGETVESIRYDFAGASGDGLNRQGLRDASVAGHLGSPPRMVSLRLVFSRDVYAGHVGHVALYHNGSLGGAGAYVRDYSLSAEHSGNNVYHDTLAINGNRWRAAIEVVPMHAGRPGFDGEWYVGPESAFMPPVWHRGRLVTVDISWKHFSVSRDSDAVPRSPPTLEIPVTSTEDEWQRGCVACSQTTYTACVSTNAERDACLRGVRVCLCPDMPESTVPQTLFDRLFEGVNLHAHGGVAPGVSRRHMTLLQGDGGSRDDEVARWRPRDFMAGHSFSQGGRPEADTAKSFQAVVSHDHVVRLTHAALWRDMTMQYEIGGGGERRTVRLYSRNARDDLDGWTFGIALASNLLYACVVLTGVDILRIPYKARDADSRRRYHFDALVPNTTWLFILVAVAVHAAAYTYGLVDALRGIRAQWRDVAGVGVDAVVAAAIVADIMVVLYVLVLRWRNVMAAIVLVARAPIAVGRDFFLRSLVRGYDASQGQIYYDAEDDLAIVNTPDFERKDNATAERVRTSIQNSDYGEFQLDAVIVIMLLLDVATIGSSAALLSGAGGTLGGDVLILISYLVTAYHVFYYVTIAASSWTTRQARNSRLVRRLRRRVLDRRIARVVSYVVLPIVVVFVVILYIPLGTLAVTRPFIDRYSDVYTGSALTIVAFFVVLTILLIASGASTSDIYTAVQIYTVALRSRKPSSGHGRPPESLLIISSNSGDTSSASHPKRS